MHHNFYAFEASTLLDGDMTLREALAHPRWKKAIQSEYNLLINNQTWELTTLPPNRRALSSQWVLQVKPALNLTHAQLKVRLVAKGFEQLPNIDYSETFAPVVKWSTLRTIIAIAAYIRLAYHPLGCHHYLFKWQVRRGHLHAPVPWL